MIGKRSKISISSGGAKVLVGYERTFWNPKDSIYSNLDKSKLMKEEKPIPDPKGKVEVLPQFWCDKLQQAQQLKHVVPPILAYAELATRKYSRNQETADRIKNQYLI